LFLEINFVGIFRILDLVFYNLISPVFVIQEKYAIFGTFYGIFILK